MFHARQHNKYLVTSMDTFDGTDPTARLHLLSRFVKECSPEHILRSQTCPIVPIFLMGKVFVYFLVAWSAFSYTGQRYWLEHFNYFRFTPVTITAF